MFFESDYLRLHHSMGGQYGQSRMPKKTFCLLRKLKARVWSEQSCPQIVIGGYAEPIGIRSSSLCRTMSKQITFYHVNDEKAKIALAD